MPTKKSQFGAEGEEFACEYLKNNGYRIIARNVMRPWGEIDIIARSGDRTLVFVEVKTMSGYSPEGIRSEDQMTKTKKKKFERASSIYAGAHPELINDKEGWRLDLVALTKIGNDFLIRHYENI